MEPKKYSQSQCSDLNPQVREIVFLQLSPKREEKAPVEKGAFKIMFCTTPRKNTFKGV